MVVFGFMLGAILGSFAFVLSGRSLQQKSFWGRSYCPLCKKKLRWIDLFPIFSYLLLAGRCRYCKKSIKIEYLLIEVIVGILVGFLFWQHFNNLNFPILISISDLLFKIFFIVILVPLFITDLKEMFIPDRIIKPAILIAVIFLILQSFFKVGYLYYFLNQSPLGQKLLPPYSDYFQRHVLLTFQPFILSIVSALAIAGFFLSLIIVTRGKGMGGGDVKLGAFIGLMLGFPQSLLAIVLSFVLGAVFSIFLIIAGKKHFGQAIPFGPFLVLGSLISLFWGSQIIDWYLKLGY